MEGRVVNTTIRQQDKPTDISVKKIYKRGLWILGGVAILALLVLLAAAGGMMYVLNRAANAPLSEPMGGEARLVKQIAHYHTQREVSPKVYRLYLQAADLPEMDRQAILGYRVAAILGYAPAQTALGEYYEYGPKPDMAKAAHLYLTAAEQGYGPAQGHVALCYLLGEGVEADAEKAAEWAAAGEKQGSAEAQFAHGAALLLKADTEEARNAASAYLFEALSQYFGKELFLDLFLQTNDETIRALQAGAQEGKAVAEASLGLLCTMGVKDAPAMGAKEIIQLLRHALRPGDTPAKLRAQMPGVDSCSKEKMQEWLKKTAAAEEKQTA